MESHLYLRRGKKCVLLVRYFDKLHFVNLDHRMNYKVRSWFLEQPRTEEEMDDKGLVRTSIDLKEIRGVAGGGTGRGMVVQFYLKEGKRRYELDKDCDLADMSFLFDGLESFAPPKKDSKWNDPRLAKQDPNLRKILWFIGVSLNILSVLSAFFIWVAGFEISWICGISLLCISASMVLYCLFPDYYSIFNERWEYGRKKGVMGLWGQVVCPAGMFLGAVYNYAWFGIWKAWFIGAAAMLTLAVILYLTAQVFCSWDKLAAVVIVGLLISGGPVLVLNDLLDPTPGQKISTEVVDRKRHRSQKGGDMYELSVILDGKNKDIPVDGGCFAETQVGDWVTVEFREGAFGIGCARIDY